LNSEAAAGGSGLGAGAGAGGVGGGLGAGCGGGGGAGGGVGGGVGGAGGGGVGVVCPPVVFCAVAGGAFFHMVTAMSMLATNRNARVPRVM
jgi:hypothetical protein